MRGGVVYEATKLRPTSLEPLCFLHRWDSSLTAAACQKSVDTDGLYSPRTLYECRKAGPIRGLRLHRVMNRAYMTVLFSGLHDTGFHKKLKATDMNHFPPRRTGPQRLPGVPQGCVYEPLINLN